MKFRAACILALVFSLVALTFSQTQTNSESALPRLVRFSGTVKDLNGNPLAGVVGITFALYSEQTGGAALWLETQNVTADSNGRYVALLGSTKPDGLPTELFTTEQARWVGVQVSGQEEQSRMLLVSAPYALKAGDAETVGGLPPSAFVLNTPVSGSGGRMNNGVPSSPSSSRAVPPSSSDVTTTGGTVNKIPLFTTATNIQNSILTQTGTTAVSAAGNLTATGIVTGSSFQIGSNLFAFGSYTNANAFLGFAGNSKTTGSYNTASGENALHSNTTGVSNTASGNAALYSNTGGYNNAASGNSALYSNTTGSYNTASGTDALYFNTTGTNNVAGGYRSLYSNTTGSYNNAYGNQALYANTTGGGNTASGDRALYANTTGFGNTASGEVALYHNTSGYANTATGSSALYTNTTGNNNTAIGEVALNSNTTGSNNTASGSNAMYFNNTGSQNTATGVEALQLNDTGSYNTVSGYQALQFNKTGSNNTASGYQALFSNEGSNNTAVGYLAGFSVGGGSNNIDIGNQGATLDSGAIRIGTAGTQTSAFIAGIYGAATSVNNAVPVLIDSNGNLGTVSSSRRYKEDIRDMGEASAGLMRLRPVTFRYKKPFADGSQPMQYGLIAEEVAEVYPDMVARSADGQIETVKYQLLDPMLLNEVQRQQAEIRELQERLSKMEAALAAVSRAAESR